MDRIYLIKLFDCYQELLTKKEQNIFSEHYEDDLSMQEIADNLNISKSAVGKKIKIVETKLLDYETKLKLYQKSQEINKLLENNKRLLEKVSRIISS